jgi:hypothetical protein
VTNEEWISGEAIARPIVVPFQWEMGIHQFIGSPVEAATRARGYELSDCPHRCLPGSLQVQRHRG